MTLIKVKSRGTNNVGGGRRNLIINGAMQVAQRGTQTGQGASNAYSAVDRFLITSTGTNGRLTSSQSTDAPAGFANSLQLVCTTADTSIAAGELNRIRHRIEGRNVQHIQKGTSGAKAITLSYHAKASTGGVIIVEIQDNDNNRISSVAHTITTSYQKFTHTFPADTTGALDNDNNTSLTVSWVLHAGSQYTSGTLGSAFTTGADANKAVGQTFSIFAATSRQFNLSGVQLEVGDTATEFEHRSFAEELQACQRYYTKSWLYENAVGTNPGVITASNVGSIHRSFGNVFWPVEMRAAPTVTWYSGSNGTVNKWRNGSQGTDITPPSPMAAIGSKGYGFVLSAGINAITDSLLGHYEASAEL